MSAKSYYLIYLTDQIENEQWAHLERFIHPGSRHQIGWKSLFCTNLDLGGPLLICLAKDHSGGGPKNLHLNYGLVASIVEVSSHSNPLGFVNPEKYLKSQEVME